MKTNKERPAEQEARRVDGQAAALQLLHSLEKMNGNRNAPAKSSRAVRAAIKGATTLPGKEFVRFSPVLSDWLVSG